MAIVALPVSEPALEEVPLFSEEFILVRPMEDAGMPVPSADKLGEMRLLLLEEGHCFRNQALSFCSTTNAPPRVLMEGWVRVPNPFSSPCAVRMAVKAAERSATAAARRRRSTNQTIAV